MRLCLSADVTITSSARIATVVTAFWIGASIHALIPIRISSARPFESDSVILRRVLLLSLFAISPPPLVATAQDTASFPLPSLPATATNPGPRSAMYLAPL